MRIAASALAATIVVASATFTVIVPQNSFGQDTEESEPLKGTRKLGDSSELLLLWSEGRTSGEKFASVLDYINLNNPDPNVPNDLVPSELQSVKSAANPEQDKAVDVIAGDFDGDNLDDYVAAWEGPDRSIEMIIPDLDRVNLKWTEPHLTTVAPAGSMVDDDQRPRIPILAKADFDDDSQSEWILSYWGADRSLQIELFETDESHQPKMLASFNDPEITYLSQEAPGQSRRSTWPFDVQAGDFDGDGTDEIVVVGGRNFDCAYSQGCWKTFMRIYDVDPESFQLVQRADTTIYTKEDNASVFMNGIAVAAGRYGPEYDEGIGVLFERTTNESDTHWFLNMSRVILAGDDEGNPLPPDQWTTAADTSYFLTGPSGTSQIHQTTGNRGFPINAEAIDFDQDGRDELTLYYRQLQVFQVDDDYKPTQIGSFGTSSEPGQYGRHLMAVADLDADNDLANESATWRPEITVVGSRDVSDDGGISTDGILNIRVYAWDPDIGYPSIRESQLEEYRIDPSGPRPLALAALDVGDNGIRVGSPKRYAKTDIVRPLVILNAPPTHFDVLEGEEFDVNKCYGEEDCACREDLARCFQADYTTETERSISVETELKTDWSVAATVKGGFHIPFSDKVKVGVKLKIKGTYGEGFSRKDKTTHTFTVQQAVQATRDDWIYAMIVNYDIWEYPLFVDGEQVSDLVFVTPKLQTRAWFDSKSWNAFDYIPEHEVGNILSYRSITSPDQNSALASAIRWDTGDQITLSGTSDVAWALTSEGETETDVQNSVRVGISGSADFNIPVPFIPNLKIEGDYTSETVNTRNIKVRDTKGMRVQFGDVDQGIGNVRYNVIPYVYWATNGALVLDYAVTPELAQPGFEGTWWQQRYGELSDPALILPWRLDREKGADITEAQTQQTHEIIFDPIQPAVGDVVTIKVRVHNWSLLPTPGPVEVQFFVGDPAAGGTPIVGTGGETSVFVGQLADRGSGTAQMQWRLPSGIGFFPRIYAVVDPNGSVEEVHEDNNTGWNVLPIASGPVSIEDDGPSALETSPAIYQNYPNPFNGTTTIAFDLPKPERATIQVVDLLGREVSRVVDQVFDAGSYNVRFDARGLSSGVYLYRLVAGRTVQTKQMMVVR